MFNRKNQLSETERNRRSKILDKLTPDLIAKAITDLYGYENKLCLDIRRQQGARNEARSGCLTFGMIITLASVFIGLSATSESDGSNHKIRNDDVMLLCAMATLIGFFSIVYSVIPNREAQDAEDESSDEEFSDVDEVSALDMLKICGVDVKETKDILREVKFVKSILIDIAEERGEAERQRHLRFH